MRLERYSRLILMLALAMSCQSRGMAQAQSSPEIPAQRFVCGAGYTPEKCQEELGLLQKVVAKYPTGALGPWTWVLVRSGDWQAMIHKLRLDPNTPAFSCLELRVTFIEEALVGKAPGRRAELVLQWHSGIDGLLDLSVRHELGHAICNEVNEEKVQGIARLLETKKAVSCEVKYASKGRVDGMNVPR